MTRAVSLERLMRDAVDAFNERDLDRFLAIMDPDVEAHTLLAELAGKPFVGHAGVRRWWSETLESWDYQTMTLDEVHEQDDTGVAMISLTGRGRASGVEIDMKLAMHFHVRDDRCTYFRIYADREEALRDAGLS